MVRYCLEGIRSLRYTNATGLYNRIDSSQTDQLYVWYANSDEEHGSSAL